MADPRAFTGNMKSVHAIMMAALHEKEGIEITWPMEEYGSLDACQKEARGFHQSFSSIRAKSRRGEESRLGERHARDTEAQGPFDGLACTVIPMPGDVGWKAWVGPWKVHLSRFNVFSVATGERVTPMGAKPQSEIEQLISDAADFLSRKTSRFSRKAFVRGERLGLWVRDGKRWFLYPEQETPSEERLRAVEEAEEDSWIGLD